MGAANMLPLGGPTPCSGVAPVAGAVRALFAECRDCERVECFRSDAGGLPAGWRELADDRAANGKAVLCPDCRHHDDELEAQAPTTPAFVHCGFRLLHSLHLAAGFATLRIHAGARARLGGPDYPATFLADRAGIRELIQQLEAIDKQLAEGVN